MTLALAALLTACGGPKSKQARNIPGEPTPPPDEYGAEIVVKPAASKDVVHQITYKCQASNILSIVNEPGREVVYWGEQGANCAPGYDLPADGLSEQDPFHGRKIEVPQDVHMEFRFYEGAKFLRYNHAYTRYELDTKILPELPVGDVGRCESLEVALVYKESLREGEGFELKEDRLHWTLTHDPVKKEPYWKPESQTGAPAPELVQGSLMDSYTFYLHCNWTSPTGELTL